MNGKEELVSIRYSIVVQEETVNTSVSADKHELLKALTCVGWL